MGSPKFSDEQIQSAVQESHSYSEALKKLGASRHSTQNLNHRIQKLGLSISHFKGCGRTSFTKERLEKVIPESKSYAEVVRKLGLKSIGGNLVCVRKAIQKHNIDISHFNHHAHNKGKVHSVRPWQEILVVQNQEQPKEVSHILRRAAKESGIEYKCSCCGLGPRWQGKTLTLQIDHINGNPRDHRKENLRFVCPNCHSQMDTYGSKNRK